MAEGQSSENSFRCHSDKAGSQRGGSQKVLETLDASCMKDY